MFITALSVVANVLINLNAHQQDNKYLNYT